MAEEGEATPATTEKLEINKELLLKYRVHLGRNIKTKFSEEFIYATHPRGFYLIDLMETVERLKVAAKFLNMFPHNEVLLYSGREYAFKALEMTSKILGYNVLYGRFLPGTLTNYMLRNHVDISLLFVVDHTYDRQAVDEAYRMKIPIVSFVDTNSNGTIIDLAIPGNNKGRSSIAVLMWILSVFILRERGLLGEEEVIDVSIEDFME